MKPMLNRSAKKALLFDVNGTLIDREQTRLAALGKVLEDFAGRWAGEDWSPEDTVRRFAAAWRRTRPASGRAKPVRILQQALRGEPLGAGEAFARKLWKRVHETAPRHAVPYPDVKDTLRELAKDYRLAIVSNGSRSRLEETLKASGLDALFPAELRFVSDRRGIKKPRPGLFRSALHKLGVTPRETVIIGDSWRNDVRGASRLGIDAIWLQRRKRRAPKPLRRIGNSRVVVISRCKQLLDVLGKD